ncbi:Exocyst complex subunit Sec8 [Ceraceosorus bombacis]|uniref:Exocyst complex component Sec8 n=1 Tax=Ceraceosorus bombacis TaxID=401625 RepID=A0A0P1BE06_9BASI|nr:Exocyst complex subunit Sec8 [Ceraceosorus bombacis]
MSRKKSTRGPDLRSRIQHSNTALGGGTETGAMPNMPRLAAGTMGAQMMPAGSGGLGLPGTSGGRMAYNAQGTQSTLASSQGIPQSGSSQGYLNTMTASSSASGQNLGAGPSFVSLTPSDSISNYEGRAGHGAAAMLASSSHGPLADVYEPSGGSTASFAQGQYEHSNQYYAHAAPGGGGETSLIPPVAHQEPSSHPARPARSVRRPQGQQQNGATAVPSARPGVEPAASSTGPGRNLLDRTRTPAARPQAGGASDRHATSARLMAQVNGQNGRETPSSVGDEDEEDPYGGMDDGHARGPSSPPLSADVSPTVGQLSGRSEPAALGSVLSALSAAGRKQGAQRILRGTTAEEESKRRRAERKVEEARSRESKPIEHYIDRRDERALRGINGVLRKVKAEWGFVAEDDFSPVALALSLLDDSSLGASRHDFEMIKDGMEQSLQGTVDDHHESFANAITLHNSVLQSLSAAQNSVSGARRRLRDSREALGQKRADLVQLWQRSQGVKESLRLLDHVEQLKGVPDRLESLMSEKRFLQAVNLLARSVKLIDKPDIQEVGATQDLRTYLKAQEQGMFEILIEELHNHLYLKSFFCDARWKSYMSGQEQLPDVDFGREYDGNTEVEPSERASAASPVAGRRMNTGANRSISGLDSVTDNEGKRATKLTRYLNNLSSRPSFDPNLATELPDLGLPPSMSSHGLTREGATMNGQPPTAGAQMSASKSSDSFAATGMTGSTNGQNNETLQAAAIFDQNPEADSFLYIEMLLESLSRLGKLGLALDIVQQRLPIELHQLVDATIDEVDQRNEPLRISSASAATTLQAATMQPESILLASSAALARSFAESTRTSFRSSFGSGLANQVASGAVGPDGRPYSTVLRLSETETSTVVRDSETMRDLFWTLFSKLDAVLQGHRVVHEVSSRIATRSALSNSGHSADANQSSVAASIRNRKTTTTTNLVAIWRPIQNEVRTLLHDHLTDDSQSATARRNAVVSVNEVLRSGQSGRDKAKKLYRLAESNTRPVGIGGGTSGGSALVTARRDMGPLRKHEEALTAALRGSVPGLVSALDPLTSTGSSISAAQREHQTAQVIVSASRLASASATMGSASSSGGEAGSSAGYRLLVKPDAFNVSVLFQPALAFVERAQRVIPGGSAASEPSGKGFSAFLDEFVQDVFLPQLDEKVQSLFASAVGGSDAFQESPTSKAFSIRPVVKSAANVIVLIDSLYSMLRTTPFHRESYSHLIIQTTVQYYQRCWDRFKDLTLVDTMDGDGLGGLRSPPIPNRGGSAQASGHAISALHFMLSADWAQRQDLSECLSEILSSSCTADRKRLLHAQENKFELALAARNSTHPGSSGPGTLSRPQNGSVRMSDLITSRKRLMALGNLQHSLRWFLAHISRLRATDQVVTVAPAPAARLSVMQGLAPNPAEVAEERDLSLPLPLGPEMATRFAALPRTYASLANTILMTLRLELRARVIHHLDLAIVEGNYLVEEAVLEPDPHVVDLNAELASLDDTFADSVSPEQHRFLFSGLASLMDTMLCASVRKIRAVNQQGVTKMIRNILALQQNLRNIVIADTSKLTSVGKQSRQGLDAGRAAINEDFERWNNFDRSRGLWELLSKEPNIMLAAIRTTPSSKKATFDDAFAPPTTPGGKMLPRAGLKPGTTDLARDVSRQKFNELLIELHEIAGDAGDDGM